MTAAETEVIAAAKALHVAAGFSSRVNRAPAYAWERLEKALSALDAQLALSPLSAAADAENGGEVGR